MDKEGLLPKYREIMGITKGICGLMDTRIHNPNCLFDALWSRKDQSLSQIITVIGPFHVKKR